MKKATKVETKTRKPNLFSVVLERNPSTGEYTVVGHQAKRLVMKNQHEGDWVKVAPRELARSLRNNKIVAC
jgi:hypothetical protein